MKRILFVFIIIITSFLFAACADEEVDSNALIQNQISTESISHIDIEKGTHIKNISHEHNINLLFNYINNIQILDNSSVDNINLDEYEPMRLKIYHSDNSLIETISISRGVVYYNGYWYSTDTRVYDEIAEFYEATDYEEVENQLIVEIEERVSNRFELPLDESLRGTWLSIDGLKIVFGDKLIQGEQTKYSFDYEINSMDDSNLNITVYGQEGFFLGGRELSTIEITMDSTKSLMRMKRTMTSGRIYQDKLIYVDEEGIALGFFDSYFFFDG